MNAGRRGNIQAAIPFVTEEIGRQGDSHVVDVSQSNLPLKNELRHVASLRPLPRNGPNNVASPVGEAD